MSFPSDWNEAKFEEIDIEEFDKLARAKQFDEGPLIDSFGDGYGEPYQPQRTVMGILKDGRRVRSTKVFK